MRNKEANFKDGTKNKLSKDSNHRCNICGISTNKITKYSIINIGIGSHIVGASDGERTPRLDKNLSNEEKGSFNNGIWLCTNCHHTIDHDESSYTVEKLLAIKDYNENILNNKNKNNFDISNLSDDEAEDLVLFNGFYIGGLVKNFDSLFDLFSTQNTLKYENEFKDLLIKSSNNEFTKENDYLFLLNTNIIHLVCLKKEILYCLFEICDYLFQDICIRIRYSKESNIYNIEQIISETLGIIDTGEKADNEILEGYFKLFEKHHKDNNFSKILKTNLQNTIDECKIKINHIKIINVKYK